MHTVKVVAYQPYSLKEGPQHWDAIKQRVSDANLKYVQRFATNLTDDKVLRPFLKEVRLVGHDFYECAFRQALVMNLRN